MLAGKDDQQTADYPLSLKAGEVPVCRYSTRTLGISVTGA